MVPGGQLAEDGTLTRLVAATSTTPGAPPGSWTWPNGSTKSSGKVPGVVVAPWLRTRPPAPTRTWSLPAEATMTVPLLRA